MAYERMGDIYGRSANALFDEMRQKPRPLSTEERLAQLLERGAAFAPAAGSAAGAAIGGYFGGPAGAQAGMGVGSAGGSAVHGLMAMNNEQAQGPREQEERDRMMRLQLMSQLSRGVV